MNCSTCQKNLEAYIAGGITDDIKSQMKTHLESCDSCNEIYELNVLKEKVIEKESSKNVNPFLATRVMAHIESIDSQKAMDYKLASEKTSVRPAFIAIAASVALFLGVTFGTSYNKSIRPQSVPTELVYLNDAAMESIHLFVND